MSVGDIVRHKLSGEIYRILKVGENVAVCQCAPHSHKLIWGWVMWESYICHLENLEMCPGGKEIFEWIDGFDDSFFSGLRGPEYRNRYKELMRFRSEIKPGTQLSLI